MPYDLNPKAPAARRRRLAPAMVGPMDGCGRAEPGGGALPRKTGHLIAVAVAHVTQSHRCIGEHWKGARRHGASVHEVMEAIWVATETRTRGTSARAAIALDEIEQPPAEDAG